MNENPKKRDDEKARAEALFRYRVLVPLLDKQAGLSLRKRVAQRAAQSHGHPSGEQRSVDPRTLWRFEVNDFDATAKRARALGAEIIQEPHINTGPRHREVWVRDADGYVVAIASPDGEAG